MKTKYLLGQREVRNPFSPNFPSRFRIRVRNITKENKTSDIEKRRYAIYD